MNNSFKVILLLSSFGARAATEWMLPNYLEQSQRSPEVLIRKAQEVMSGGISNQVEDASLKKSGAMANWQDRMALVMALSEIYSPDQKISNQEILQSEVRAILHQALLDDPALLVRDSVVESFRRIIRMNLKEAVKWQSVLEKAYFDEKNSIEGDGLFIKETILTAMREASLKPSSKILASARKDQNPRVRELLQLWDTNSF